MALIQRADLVERMRRAFGLRERGVGSTVSPELVPVILVEDLTGPSIDEGYPRFATAYSAAGASVGVFSEVFLINPAGSSVDLVLQEIWGARDGTAGDIQIRTGNAAALNNLLNTQTIRSNLDLRVQRFPNATVNSRNQAAVIGSQWEFHVVGVAPTWVVIPSQYTVPPGSWISLVPTGNNTGIRARFYWYERLRTTS